jgi:hypothetical protein
MNPNSNPIPTWAQSSTDPTEVSLTLTSIGKAGAGIITFLAMLGIVDPLITGQAWSELVASILTAVPAGFAVWHAGYVIWGLIRKLSVRLFSQAPTQKYR